MFVFLIRQVLCICVYTLGCAPLSTRAIVAAVLCVTMMLQCAPWARCVFVCVFAEFVGPFISYTVVSLFRGAVCFDIVVLYGLPVGHMLV